MTRYAKIVCTLGPASNDWHTISELVAAGMSVARLNASHGDRESRRRSIERVREVEVESEEPVAVLLDLPGPEVRTAPLDDPITIADGSSVTFLVGDTATAERIGVSRSIGAARPGDALLLDDGRIEGTVTDADGDTITVRIDSGGRLDGRASVNLPGVDLGLPVVTDHDEAELDLAAETGVDFVAASFVRSGNDVLEINRELEARGADIPIVAKIERAEAVENLESIIDAADGIMVARGDLGVECPLEDVPLIQKRLIRRCHRAGVPSITATEMLDSMVHQPRPTRAEASDVANAVLDGTDAVMLSAETAVGDHPVTVVETMDRIIRDIEASEEYDEAQDQRVPPADATRTDALARSARYLARDVGATAIVAASESGYTARKAAKYRPDMPIVASTPDERVRRQLALTWGITPMYVPYTTSGADAVIQNAVQAALDAGAADPGDTVVVLSGMMTELEGMDTANMLKVHVVAERLASGRSVVEGHVTGPFYRIGDGDLSAVPEDVILGVPAEFDATFEGDTSRIGGIIDAHSGVTGYAAIVARELDVPMICGVDLPEDIDDGTPITLDAERGVVYTAPSANQEE